MPFWQEALGLLAVLWACQAAGTWMQMRHYRAVMQQIAQTWPDGCVGASAARGYLGKGAIAIVVAGPDATVRQVLVMEGRSVFAKFKELPERRGSSLAALAEVPNAAPKGRQAAMAGAIRQLRAALARHAAQAAEAPAGAGAPQPA